MPFRAQLRTWSTTLVLCWGLVVAVGIMVVQLHSTRPGNSGDSIRDWPDETTVERDERRPTLLIFIDPRCPCSRASMSELVSIMGRVGDRVSATAVLSYPLSGRDAGDDADVRTELASISPLEVLDDGGLAEAARFGIETSGHVLLYDVKGRLVFSGGITAARGHRGENYGRDAVIAQISGPREVRRVHPVFGCPLAVRERKLPRRSRDDVGDG